MSVFVASAAAQFDLDFDLTLNERAVTPVPILRSIDRQNADGSYTYGYESGDGTYKIETRYATGEVRGKYGYIDSNGELREVEYGATPGRGFEPRAEGLVVAPPTLPETTVEAVQTEAPVVVSQPQQFSNFAPTRAAAAKRVVVRKKDRRTRLPIRGSPTRQTFAPQPVQPVQPVAVDPHRFSGHPAQNIDLLTGSYTVSYSG